MNTNAQNSIFNAILVIASILICFIILMAFSNPMAMIFDQLVESGNQTSQSIGENMSTYRDMGNRIYSIIFAVVMIGGAAALFLGIAIRRRRRPPYEEYERYGGDYNGW